MGKFPAQPTCPKVSRKVSPYHLIIGNHDISGSRQGPLRKGGIIAHEGLILRHTKTGQQIFVVHGHQAEFLSDRLYVMSRFLVRHFWKPLQLLGLVGTASLADQTRKRGKIEERIIEWIKDYRQITVCGHTHHPACTWNGMPPYFNTGSCVYPGYITGLELQDGELVLVKWTAQPSKRERETTQIKRELLAPPSKLHLLRA